MEDGDIYIVKNLIKKILIIFHEDIHTNDWGKALDIAVSALHGVIINLVNNYFYGTNANKEKAIKEIYKKLSDERGININ